jgi:hypothetical protein
MRQQSMPAVQYNQALFAFRLARKQTGRTIAAYSSEGGRAAMNKDPILLKPLLQLRLGFAKWTRDSSKRQTDPFRDALLESMRSSR